MAVLIKGLTKPHTCGDCWFGHCDRWRKRNWGAPPPDDCPIEAAPADVVEVRHGRWVYGHDPDTGEQDIKAWTCSLCGEKYPWQPTYCPNCGARMDSEE